MNPLDYVKLGVKHFWLDNLLLCSSIASSICSVVSSRAQNNSRSTDNVRPNLRFDRSTSHLSGHLVRSGLNLGGKFHVTFYSVLSSKKINQQWLDCLKFHWAQKKMLSAVEPEDRLPYWFEVIHHHKVGQNGDGSSTTIASVLCLPLQVILFSCVLRLISKFKPLYKLRQGY